MSLEFHSVPTHAAQKQMSLERGGPIKYGVLKLAEYVNRLTDSAALATKVETSVLGERKKNTMNELF